MRENSTEAVCCVKVTLMFVNSSAGPEHHRPVHPMRSALSARRVCIVCDRDLKPVGELAMGPSRLGAVDAEVVNSSSAG